MDLEKKTLKQQDPILILQVERERPRSFPQS